MFNPKFRKFRQNKIIASKKKLSSNKITNFFTPQESGHNSTEDGKKVVPSKKSKTDSNEESAKEKLGQFSRKRQASSQAATSSRKQVRKEEKESDKSSKSNGTKFTPFELQVVELKKNHPGMILMIQSGYKYFFYGEDAEVSSKVLNIAAYPNHNFLRSSIPVERLHVHARKLVEAGYKVGVIQQQEVAELKALSESKNTIFDRKLTAVYTKATAIGEEINPLKQSASRCEEEVSAHYILSLAELIEGSKVCIGIVAFDAGTGEAYFDKFTDGANRDELEKRLEHLSPAEILISETLSQTTQTVIKHNSQARVERLPDSKFNFSTGLMNTAIFLSSAENTSTHLTDLPPAVVSALSALLDYLREFDLQGSLLPENLKSFTACELYVQLDGATVRNLEIFKSSNDTHYGSLLWLFDQHSHTHFGSRVLREWLSQPLRDVETIQQRQDAVEELLQCSAQSVGELYSLLQKIPDVDRGLTTVLLNRSTPSSVYSILENLKCLKERLEAIIGASDLSLSSPLLNSLITESAQLLSHIPRFLGNMNEEAASKGDVTKFLKDYSNYPAVVDLQKEIQGVEKQLEALLPAIARKLGVTNVKYMSVYGTEYLIEVKIKHTVPADWMKISETKHLSRYHTPEVSKLHSELTVLKAKLKQECHVSWNAYIASFNEHYKSHKKAVKNIANLDALIALCQLARSDGYCRPELIDGPNAVINISKGKHPIVSKISSGFVPNNTSLEGTEESCMVLSGPNMGGKSCYIRQVALITIMAHIGSFVPAESATISTLDAVYTRIGARDEILSGRSTLMLEMDEAALILRKATCLSLVLMDELGRGTSSHDGAAIAAATLSHLVYKVQCLTLFITHYPSVMDVFPDYNFHMGFMVSKLGEESPDMLTFLYVVSPGKASSSYGLNVCRLAGVSDSFTENASRKADELQAAAEQKKLSKKAFSSLWRAKSISEIKEVVTTLLSE